MEIRNKKILFYRESESWFAAVDGHTKEENEIIGNANIVLDRMSHGKRIAILTISGFSDKRNLPDIPHLTFQLISSDEYGARYRPNIGQKDIWLCTVLKTVFGNYPEYIVVEDRAFRDWEGPEHNESRRLSEYLNPDVLKIYKEEIEAEP